MDDLSGGNNLLNGGESGEAALKEKLSATQSCLPAHRRRCGWCGAVWCGVVVAVVYLP
jgi:hypothetical protein